MKMMMVLSKKMIMILEKIRELRAQTKERKGDVAWAQKGEVRTPRGRFG